MPQHPSPITHHPSPDVLDGIATLVEQSLVRSEEQADGEPRFIILETIREYGLEQLANAGEDDATRRAHAAYFMELAERAETELTGPRQAFWLIRLENEHDNLRAALSWSLNTGTADTALRLAAALWSFWAPRGHLVEGRGWLEKALAHSNAATPAVQAKAIHHLANFLIDLGDYPRAQSLLASSLAIRQQIGDQRGVAGTFNGLGIVATDTGDYAQARTFHEQSLAIRQQEGDRRGEALSLHNLGRLAAAEGDLARAHSLHQEALAIRHELGDTGGVAYSYWNLGQVALALGDEATATQRFEQSLATFRQIGDKLGVAFTLHDLGDLALRKLDLQRSAAYYQEALTLRRSLGEKQGVIECLEGIARTSIAHEQPTSGVQLAAAADAAREALGIPLPPGARDDRDNRLGAARRALGSSTFDAAWAAGRTIPIEQAAADAMTVTATLQQEVAPPKPIAPTNTFGLTAREIEVLRLIAEGQSDPQIAEVLYISRRTVSTHVMSILNKLGVNSRSAAAALAVRRGLV